MIPSSWADVQRQFERADRQDSSDSPASSESTLPSG